VVATLATLDAPADLVFAGNPARAYVSCTTVNTLQVFDPISQVLTGAIVIEGERPKALATSPDGRFVYAAIFESGNGSTILAGELGQVTDPELAGPVDYPDGPYGGANPPPNFGDKFLPAITTNLPVAPPRVPQIVKKSSDGRWFDDNQGDWTRFVSGQQAALSGRVPGWDLPDHDLALVDTRDNSVRYVNGLMNLCFALAVNPVSGQVAVVGTDGINERRFVPRLQSIFHRVKLAFVNPTTAASQISDLNPHLDYTQPSLPQALRNRSLGDPRGVVWSADGTRAYVSGMGSGNVVVLDSAGARVGEPIELGTFPGPTGLVFADERHRLYVFNRFSSELAVVNTDTKAVVSKARIFDPTPASVRNGRQYFYDTHGTSGLGQAACASCHPDGRFDRLAWDLGAPDGQMVLLGLVNFPISERPSGDYHPMKGPMTTQTLQDIIGHEPFHWRGDRGGIEDFNPTFKDLQGADEELTAVEMAELKAFLATITYPPNPLRNPDNSLPTSLPLPGQRALGHGTLPAGAPLPNGNAQAGLLSFQQNGRCSLCHSLPTGLGSHQRFTNNFFQTLPSGTNGAAHVALVGAERSAGLPFKIASLRSLRDKMGFDRSGPNGRSGFGLMHEGGVDSLPRFLNDGFNLTADQDVANVIAFLLAFTGSDLPAGTTNNVNLPPGLPSRDMPAAVGRQVTITTPASLSRLTDMIRLANSPTGRVDLIVHAASNGIPQGWVFNRATFNFTPDLAGDPTPTAD
jgi:DNA-binding beta-propeller fold protein YncE